MTVQIAAPAGARRAALPVVARSPLWWVLPATNSENFYVAAAAPDPDGVRRHLVRRAAARPTCCPACCGSRVGYLLAARARHRGSGVRDRHDPAAARAPAEPVLEFFRAVPPPVLVPVIMLFAGHRQLHEGHRDRLRLRLAGPAQHRRGRPRRRRRAVATPPAPTASTGVGAAAAPGAAGGQPADRRPALRQALSIAIILMVISEMFAASNGLGFTIVQFQRSFADPRDVERHHPARAASASLLSVLFQLAERRVLCLVSHEASVAAERATAATSSPETADATSCSTSTACRRSTARQPRRWRRCATSRSPSRAVSWSAWSARPAAGKTTLLRCIAGLLDADRRRGDARRRDGHRAAAGHGRGLPGVRPQPVPLDDRARQRRAAAAAEEAPQGRARASWSTRRWPRSA